MSRALLFPILLFCCLIVVTGCGGGESSPTGGGGGGGGPFSNASVSGTYAFLFSSGANGAAGSFKADGAGNLTNGTMEINNEAQIAGAVPFTGTYAVSSDGRGTATLNTQVETFNLHFVIISSTHLLVTHFNSGSADFNLHGNGTIDLQDPNAFSASALKGQFAYLLNGVGMHIGGFILDGTGAISSGVHDMLDPSASLPITNQPLTGTYSVPQGTNGRGTLVLNTGVGVRNFVFYIVSSDHLKIIAADRPTYATGEAFIGFNPTPGNPGCGPCVFFWSSKPELTTVTIGAGMFTHDSAGTITGGSEDFFDEQGSAAGAQSNVITNGTMTFSPQFRYTMTLNMGPDSRTAVAYPSSHGVLLMSISFRAMSGVALTQAASTTPPSLFVEGTYGFNSEASNIFFGSVNFTGENIGLFSTSDPNRTGAGSFSVIRDINGNTVVNQSLIGNFTMDNTGRGTATGGMGNLILWAPNPQTFFFMLRGPDVNYGVMELQAR